MKIAVVGAGISGLSAAHHLAPDHEVSLFEAGNYWGGHTDTHRLDLGDEVQHVDTGFIVFNPENYPHFSALLQALGVSSLPTEMSFSVQNLRSGLEYNASDLNRLFCQRRNLVNPRFYRMLWDLLRFYRQAPSLLQEEDTRLTLGAYLEANQYSEAFVHDHLIPMACALWSGPSASLVEFPARYFVQFMHNHRMLSLTHRPQWRVVEGGSQRYVEAIMQQLSAHAYLSSPVQRIARDNSGVTLHVNGEALRFDKVVIATHSDQALRMLAQPSLTEVEILGGIAYQDNEIQLHSDTRILPKQRSAWASWNVRVSPALHQQATVSYDMNRLQRLESRYPFIVSLNSAEYVDPQSVYLSRRYSHPVYTQSTIAAQRRWAELAGFQHTYYCGAYWGWGFHEDGIRSSLRVVDHIKQGLMPGQVGV